MQVQLTSLSVPELDGIEATAQLLNVSQSLLHVVKVHVRCILASSSTLPVCESVRKQYIHTTLDNSISCTIRNLIPGVGSATLEVPAKCLLHVQDLRQELLAGEVPTVESLGADSHSVDLVLVLGNVRGQGVLVGSKARISVRPYSKDYLEAFGFGGRQDLLRKVTIRGSIAAYDCGTGLCFDGIKVLFVRILEFARS